MHAEGDAFSIIALYVNNITMVTSSLASINQDKEALKHCYKMTNLGELSWILGMHVSYNHDTRWIAVS